jgi:hypothetical protein
MHADDPAAGIRASALDLGRYLIMLLGNGTTPDGTQIASPESLIETWTAQVEINPEPFLESARSGLGWDIVSYQGVEFVTKSGSISGFFSKVGFIPEADIGIVVLSNADVIGSLFVQTLPYHLIELAYGLDPLIDEFAQAQYEGVVGLDEELLGQLQPVDPEVIAPFLGSYGLIGLPFVVELRGESLRVSRGTIDTIELLAAPDGSYVAISGGVMMFQPFSFAQAEDGSISLNIFGALDFPKLD